MSSKFNNILGWGASFNKYTKYAHASLTNFFNNIPYISLGTGVALGACAANKTEINILNWKPILLGKDLMKTYERILDKEILENRMELFAIASTTNQLLFHNILLLENTAWQIAARDMIKLGETTEAAILLNLWKNFRLNFLYLGLCIFPLNTLSQYTNALLNNYFSKQLSYIIEDSINAEWLKNSTATKLSSLTSGTSLIHHKTDDIATMAKAGSNLLADAFSKIIGGITGIGFVVNNNAMDFLIYLFLYNEATSSVSKLIAEKTNKDEDSIRDLEALKDNIEKDIINNAETIEEHGGIPYHLEKLTRLNHKLRGLCEEKRTWDDLQDIWRTAKDLFSSIIFNYSIIAYKISIGELNYNVRLQLFDNIIKAFSAVSFEMDNAGIIMQIEKANESINKLIDSMRNDTMAIDQYNKEYKQGNLSITLKNFTVSIQDVKKLMWIKDLQLTQGIYAIMGEKGSGKTSVTSKIRGSQYNGILAEGTITFLTPSATEPIIVSIPQIDHIPLNCSLLELFYYPQQLPTDGDKLKNLSETIQILWKKLGPLNITETSKESLMAKLNDVENWETRLSGGEKKSIFLISGILQFIMPSKPGKPSILNLDETFVGLDTKSIKSAQNLIKEYIPAESIVLSIDHHAAKENDFYHKYLNLLNGTIVMHDKCMVDYHKTCSQILTDKIEADGKFLPGDLIKDICREIEEIYKTS
jgi:ABC-type uncharacterized transport system fused permease/ATPase subunit